jgi:hypothetical protein
MGFPTGINLGAVRVWGSGCRGRSGWLRGHGLRGDGGDRLRCNGHRGGRLGCCRGGSASSIFTSDTIPVAVQVSVVSGVSGGDVVAARCSGFRAISERGLVGFRLLYILLGLPLSCDRHGRRIESISIAADSPVILRQRLAVTRIQNPLHRGLMHR